MDKKLPKQRWVHIGVLALVIGVVVGAVRVGHMHGRASGGEVGCGGAVEPAQPDPGRVALAGASGPKMAAVRRKGGVQLSPRTLLHVWNSRTHHRTPAASNAAAAPDVTP